MLFSIRQRPLVINLTCLRLRMPPLPTRRHAEAWRIAPRLGEGRLPVSYNCAACYRWPAATRPEKPGQLRGESVDDHGAQFSLRLTQATRAVGAFSLRLRLPRLARRLSRQREGVAEEKSRETPR